MNGFEFASQYPLTTALFRRRTHRLAVGLREVRAGSLTYRSDQPPQPLNELEEAMLIASVGTTGFTLPDRPYEDEHGKPILASPNIDSMMGRAAGSPDNARATHFFLINDSGTYFLRQIKDPTEDYSWTPENLIRLANKSKVRVLDRRLDLPRKFPYYLDSNRFLSNLAGTTILLPIVDLTRQYINGLMYLMTEEPGRRPTIVDDRNFYRPAGVKKWSDSGYLNAKMRLPLSIMGTFRAELEATLLLQNAMLMTQAMGLGGWIHATMGPPFMLGHPLYASDPGYADAKGLGLNFTYDTPRRKWFGLLDLVRWGVHIPTVRANPVGMGDLIQGLCPPYRSMNEAVDELVRLKYGADGTYNDAKYFNRILRGPFGDSYLREVPKFDDNTIAVVKAICTYIHETHGRFPAHCDAMHVPGIWLQAHHIDTKYYDYLFRDGYTEVQREHAERWHTA
jgi:hypothetical protein